MRTWRAHDLEQTTKLYDRRQTADHVADFPDLIAVTAFSVIGLLMAANLMLRLPDLALTVEQFNAFAGP
jgi:hypothetical protein